MTCKFWNEIGRSKNHLLFQGSDKNNATNLYRNLSKCEIEESAEKMQFVSED